MGRRRKTDTGKSARKSYSSGGDYEPEVIAAMRFFTSLTSSLVKDLEKAN
jgi:hypothetical protein